MKMSPDSWNTDGQGDGGHHRGEARLDEGVVAMGTVGVAG